ncbi:hypothetical protein CARUB_v10002625mg [Capsella rubella]|uniref:Apple domain-containing protein n=1 Tax=Capsella rubella TaxID=81985 RepID=R0FI89_9BRAS|nr:hypothetical protein CARUB_v10002625mg [Capsella rubella]
MKIGFNLRTKKEVSVTSWISDQFPVSGAFRLGLDRSGANQLLSYPDATLIMNSSSIKKGNSSVLPSWFLDTLGQITVTNVVSSSNSSNWISEISEPCKTDSKNSSAICITEKPTACRQGRGYMMDSGYFDGDSLNTGLSDCHGSCRRNCSCIAFQTFSNGLGCQYWGKGSKFVPYDSFNFKLITYVLDFVQ